MSFRLRLQETAETLQEFELAWEQRYFDGQQLLTDLDTAAAGIYLLGYTAEMILKTAYFRFLGENSSTEVSSLLYAADFKKTVRGSAFETENMHSLEFWAELLLDARRQADRRLPKHIEDRFRSCITVLHANWWVEMRYRSLRAGVQEWREVIENVGWLRNHHLTLWR